MHILIIFLLLILIHNVDVCVSSLKRRPNIILLLIDDLGWNDVGFHLSNHMNTPNIDSLASDAILLNKYYTQPLCTPSRAALLTGKHPIHTSTQNFVILAASPWGLPLEHKILPQYLKEYGYSTHAIGKWHLGFYRKEYLPINRGFDSHIGFWNSGEDYFNHSFLERGFMGYDFRKDLDVIPKAYASGIYTTEYFTDRAVNLISNHNASQPLFLYMAYQNVHSGNDYDPLQAPQELIDKFSFIKDEKRRKFAANAYSLDSSIGKIVDKLHNKQMLENSIILFLSDNGGAYSGFSENFASNYPLRGTKGTLWEGGVRVPAFIWSPLLKNSGYVSNSSLQVFDILPTIMEAIDENSIKFIKNKVDGISMWESLSHKKCPKQRELLLNIDPIWNMSAIIDDNWKLIQGIPPSNYCPKPDDYSPSYDSTISRNQTSFVAKKLRAEIFNSTVYKILKNLGRVPNFNIFNETIIECGFRDQNKSTKCDLSQDLCLFDINSDPCEHNNLAKKYPHIVKKLWQKIVNYNKTAVKPLGTTPIDPKANPIYHNDNWNVWIH